MNSPDVPKVVVGHSVFIASTAYIGGAVTLGDDCSVMHHATIRGDVSAIRIGNRVNIQDGAVVHTHRGVDLDIDSDVSIGHRAVVHCTKIMTGSLIGIGAIVLDGCIVGRNCIIAAGAVVPPNSTIPDGKVVMGVPGRVVRETTEDERRYAQYVVSSYMELGRLHAAGDYPNANPAMASSIAIKHTRTRAG